MDRQVSAQPSSRFSPRMAASAAIKEEMDTYFRAVWIGSDQVLVNGNLMSPIERGSWPWSFSFYLEGYLEPPCSLTANHFHTWSIPKDARPLMTACWEAGLIVRKQAEYLATHHQLDGNHTKFAKEGMSVFWHTFFKGRDVFPCGVDLHHNKILLAQPIINTLFAKGCELHGCGLQYVDNQITWEDYTAQNRDQSALKTQSGMMFMPNCANTLGRAMARHNPKKAEHRTYKAECFCGNLLSPGHSTYVQHFRENTECLEKCHNKFGYGNQAHPRGKPIDHGQDPERYHCYGCQTDHRTIRDYALHKEYRSLFSVSDTPEISYALKSNKVSGHCLKTIVQVIEGASAGATSSAVATTWPVHTCLGCKEQFEKREELCEHLDLLGKTPGLIQHHLWKMLQQRRLANMPDRS